MRNDRNRDQIEALELFRYGGLHDGRFFKVALDHFIAQVRKEHDGS